MRTDGITPYLFGVAWSQWEAYSNEVYSPRHLYQCQASVSQPNHIDWGEQTRCSGASSFTGRNPYCAIGMDRAARPVLGDTSSPFMLAVVTHKAGTIYCSLARLLKMGQELSWTTISFPAGIWDYSMPTCCFKDDPVEPELLVAFRALNDSGEPVITKYLVYEVEDVWTSTPSFAATALYEITGDNEELPEARPVIAVSPFGERGIAYIGPDSNAYITIRSNGSSETIQLSGDANNSTNSQWIDLAVDSNTLEKNGAYIGGKFCVAFDGEDSKQYRQIYVTRQE